MFNYGFIIPVYNRPDEIKELLASGNVSVKVTQNLDKDTVIAEVYIDGTSLSQLLIELGYANSINN